MDEFIHNDNFKKIHIDRNITPKKRERSLKEAIDVKNHKIDLSVEQKI